MEPINCHKCSKVLNPTGARRSLWLRYEGNPYCFGCYPGEMIGVGGSVGSDVDGITSPNTLEYTQAVKIIELEEQLKQAQERVKKLEEALTSIAAFDLSDGDLLYMEDPKEVMMADTFIARESLKGDT